MTNIELEDRNFIDGAAWRDDMPYDEYRDLLRAAAALVADVDAPSLRSFVERGRDTFSGTRLG